MEKPIGATAAFGDLGGQPASTRPEVIGATSLETHGHFVDLCALLA
jgi:hypothetical protein